MRFNIAAFAALACLCAARAFSEASVTALPDGFFLRGISDDGRVAVGSFTMSGARWTAEDGLTLVNQFERYSSMTDVSADGEIAAGFTGRYGPAGYWRGSEQISHGLPGDNSFFQTATKVSADGRVIVGSFYQFSSPGSTLARWEFSGNTPHLVSTGLALGALIGGLSGDGSVMAGTFNDGAFLWSAATGAVDLGQLTLGASSRAEGLSRDGTVVFGMSGSQVFRWTLETGMVALSGPSEVSTTALAINNDGSLAVGFGQFVWSEGTGFIPILQWLNQRGANMDGWNISQLSDLSGDGSVVAGSGRDPDGVSRNFIVMGLGAVPESLTYGIATTGILILTVITRGRRRGDPSNS